MLHILRFALPGAMWVLAASAAYGQPLVPLDGRAIMDEVARRHERSHEVSAERMILYDRGAVEANRGLRRYIGQPDDAEAHRYLIYYTSPSGIAGSASLTWEVKGGQDDQWLYLPALGRLKRIVGGARRDSFLGTDFAFEDLTVEDEDAYVYSREPDADLDGRRHFVILAEPTASDIVADTAYAARRIYVRSDIFFISRIDYFERRSGTHIKTLSVDEARRIEGDAWRAVIYSMRNHVEDHETYVEVETVSFAAADVPSEVFEHRFLTSRAHLR